MYKRQAIGSAVDVFGYREELPERLPGVNSSIITALDCPAAFPVSYTHLEPGMLALIAALVSVAFKEALYRYTVFKGKRLNSQAVVANAWHHRSDCLLYTSRCV